MKKAFVDTGIFINILNKEPGFEKSSLFLERVLQEKISAFISVTTLAEILSIYYKIGEQNAISAKSYIEQIFGEERILPVVKEIAEEAGKIKAKYKISLGDALIAAGAILTGCDCLVSLDLELKEIDLIKVKEPKDMV